MSELRPGLWRWTAPHPAWRPGADWPQDVGCVAYRTEAELVLIDPLVEDWSDIDRLVEEARVPVTTALTAPWHRRSTDAVAERYGARIADLDAVPGATSFAVPPEEERQAVLFLPGFGALVVAEVLQDLGEGLAVCPSPKLRDPDVLRPSLEPLLGLPVEMILLAHGPPVLDNARSRLAQAVAPSAAYTSS